MAESNFDPNTNWPRVSKERAAEMFANGTPVTELALEFELSARQMRRWIESAEAQEIIRSIRRASCSAATGQMIQRLAKAGRKIDELMDSGDERVALAASRQAFDVALKLRAFEEFDQRLGAVEKACGLGKADAGTGTEEKAAS